MKRSVSSILATFLSIACIVHCALIPLVLVSAPIAALTWLDHLEWLEIPLITLAIVITANRSIHSYRKHHHSLIPLLAIGLAVVFIVLQWILHELHDHGKNTLFIIGVSILIIAQMLNYVLCRIHGTGRCHRKKSHCQH